MEEYFSVKTWGRIMLRRASGPATSPKRTSLKTATTVSLDETISRKILIYEPGVFGTQRYSEISFK